MTDGLRREVDGGGEHTLQALPFGSDLGVVREPQLREERVVEPALIGDELVDAVERDLRGGVQYRDLRECLQQAGVLEKGPSPQR